MQIIKCSQFHLYIICLFLIIASSCQPNSQDQKPSNSLSKPEAKETKADFQIPRWAKNANIYEVNLRQFTQEGTIEAFKEHVPRLKEMGVDILWFMPMHRISKAKRKGKLGSYYAVADYTSLNPEYGKAEDFKGLVKLIHKEGMKVIIDWVPNHTGWDNPWITEHPEWYTQDENGNIIDPIDPGTGESWGWTDVADLNYDVPEMRNAMINAMEFWIDQYDIDGFRQDVAHNVPTDFWQETAKRLTAKKADIFLLAESEIEDHRNLDCFHVTYGWSFHHLMNEIAKGEKNANDVYNWYQEDRQKFKKGLHMHFTSNHDENTWSGTVFDRMGDAHKQMAILSATFDGMPLIYGGQEEPIKKRLKFFEKDNIGFDKLEYEEFYSRLLFLKHHNHALWNGRYGVEPEFLEYGSNILAFQKEKRGQKIICIFNLSDKEAKYKLPVDVKNMEEFLGKRFTDMKAGQEINLKPWGTLIFASL